MSDEAVAEDALAFTLREMVIGDAPAMARLEAEVSAEPWSEALFAGELDMAVAVRHWLVVSSGEHLVGFGGLMYVPVTDEGDLSHEAHLMNIAVHPHCQRRGLAQRLLAELLVEARRRRTASVTLEVRPDNSPAIALYERFGLASVGTRPGYYNDGEDALMMTVNGIMTDEYGDRLIGLLPDRGAKGRGEKGRGVEDR